YLLWHLVDEPVLCVVFEHLPLVVTLLEIIFQTQIIRHARFHFHLFFQFGLASPFLQFFGYLHHVPSQS
ncbi:unnamed protein product, partial [Brassica rapa subsp. narinosa]